MSRALDNAVPTLLVGGGHEACRADPKASHEEASDATQDARGGDGVPWRSPWEVLQRDIQTKFLGPKFPASFGCTTVFPSFSFVTCTKATDWDDWDVAIECRGARSAAFPLRVPLLTKQGTVTAIASRAKNGSSTRRDMLATLWG
eukprot:s124_g2.t1